MTILETKIDSEAQRRAQPETEAFQARLEDFLEALSREFGDKLDLRRDIQGYLHLAPARALARQNHGEPQLDSWAAELVDAYRKKRADVHARRIASQLMETIPPETQTLKR